MRYMAIAPRPIMKAQKNPRRAPSLTMVMLMGPTGMETTKPLIKPAMPAVKRELNWSIRSVQRFVAVVLILVFFFDFLAHFAGDSRTDEAINQVGGKY